MTTYALGRKPQFDSRSLAYLVQPAGPIVSASWKRRIPILDQGQLGSCVGNAATGLLGTDPFSVTPTLDEPYGVQLYSDASKLDDDPANYPPSDTGTSGLAVAKALKARGLISGYTHITSLAAAHTAIQTGPFITGISWYNQMFEPDANNIVSIGGPVAGGHEIEVVGYDAAKGLWRMANSWGTSWGDAGFFFMTDATYARLLSEQGDATVLVPASQPTPIPTPTPSNIDVILWNAVKGWAGAKHYTAATKAVAAALISWAHGHGLT